MEKKTNSGIIIRAIRLYYNYTQSDFAAILGVSQGALSRIEAHQLGLSADQWINFCIKFSLDPHCLTTGIVQVLPRNINESGFKIPKIYSGDEVATVRYLFPLIKLMKKTLGENYYEKFLKDNKLDYVYFHILSNSINSNLIRLFFLDLYKNRKLNNAIFNELLDLLKHEDIYPAAFKLLDQSLSVEEKYKTIFKLFHDHFNQDISLNSAMVSPLAFIDKTGDETTDFYNKFKIDYLAAFVDQFQDQFQDNHWQFKVISNESGLGLYRAN